MLGIITCVFNPTNSRKIRDNYAQFRKHLNHPILTVELAFNDQPFFIEDAIQIRGTDENLMWQKERLLNIALESLPEQIDKIAWLDADIIFKNNSWAEETEKKLETHKVVQPFEFVYERNSCSEPVNHGMSFGKYMESHDTVQPWPQPWPKVGIAWAAQRSVLKNGFFDRHILGASDTYQLLSWLHLWDHEMIGRLNPYLRKEFLLWAWDSAVCVNKDISYIKGIVEHLPHGTLANRQYYDRDKILVEHEFNPFEDISLDSNGIYKWNRNKLVLHQKVRAYFESRNEDALRPVTQKR